MGYLQNNEALQEKVDALNLSSAAIGNIIYLPALDSQQVPEWLEEFLEYTHESDIARLNTYWPEMQATIDSFSDVTARETASFMEQFAIDLRQGCDFPLLVEVLICHGIYGVDLNKAGDVVGSTSSWNSYSKTAVFAMSMDDAITQATALGTANLKAWLAKNE